MCRYLRAQGLCWVSCTYSVALLCYLTFAFGDIWLARWVNRRSELTPGDYMRCAMLSLPLTPC